MNERGGLGPISRRGLLRGGLGLAGVAALSRLAPHPAQHVARQLSRRTGDRYRVVIAPGRTAFLDDGGVRASAILINSDTVSVRGRGGFVRVQGEDQAQVTVVPRRGSSDEIHLLSGRVGSTLTQAAATELDRALRGPAGDTEMAVLGAGFSAFRCALPGLTRQNFDCAPQAFWSHLTRTRAYDEAAFVGDSRASTRRYTNFLFARGRVYTISVSTGGNTWTDVASGTWPQTKAAKTAIFDPVEAELVRLTARRSGGGQFASAAEIRIR